MSGTHHTATFDNIPPEKRERILRSAAYILGRDGIAGARMADVAKEAAVSHGSIFSYFPTKDHLVRAVMERGMALQAERFAASDSGLGFFETVQSVFRAAWDLADAEPELISLWLSLSLTENSRFAEAMLPLEKEGALFWARLVQRGMDDAILDPSIDPNLAAYLLDAFAAQLMKSRASPIERQKLTLILGESVDAVPDRLARFVMERLGKPGLSKPGNDFGKLL